MYSKLSFGIKNLSKIIMSIVFVAHVSYIVYEIIHPAFPEIVNYKKDLHEIEYPITFKRGTQKWGFLYPRRQLLRTLKSYNDEILHVGKLFGVL